MASWTQRKDKKAIISQAGRNIDEDTFKKFYKNMENRLHFVLKAIGRSFENLIN